MLRVAYYNTGSFLNYSSEQKNRFKNNRYHHGIPVYDLTNETEINTRVHISRTSFSKY